MKPEGARGKTSAFGLLLAKCLHWLSDPTSGSRLPSKHDPPPPFPAVPRQVRVRRGFPSCWYLTMLAQLLSSRNVPNGDHSTRRKAFQFPRDELNTKQRVLAAASCRGFPYSCREPLKWEADYLRKCDIGVETNFALLSFSRQPTVLRARSK